MRIGAHMSAAGGVTRAVDRAVLHGCETLQIFTKSNARWQGKPISPEEARHFRRGVEGAGLHPVVSHASYLINMAAPPGPLRDRSLEALVDELERARLLGLLGVVVHPGSAAVGETVEQAIARVADAIRTALSRQSRVRTMILIEHTAGQGRAVGHTFEQLAAILEGVDGSARVGVCLDTCHLLAAGYDISSSAGYDATFSSFSRIVGLDRLRFIHANDSKRPCGSRVDRHEHIGRGHVGLNAFRRLLHDLRLAHLGLAIETEKTKGLCDASGPARLDPLDRWNLDTLRQLRSSR